MSWPPSVCLPPLSFVDASTAFLAPGSASWWNSGDTTSLGFSNVHEDYQEG